MPRQVEQGQAVMKLFDIARNQAYWTACLIALAVLFFIQTNPAYAHGGRTAADGCHNDNKNGGRHCHGGGAPSPPWQTPQRAFGGAVYYPNCDAARAAGAAPLSRGDPGYASYLDRDNDGIACEPYRGR